MSKDFVRTSMPNPRVPPELYRPYESFSDDRLAELIARKEELEYSAPAFNELIGLVEEGELRLSIRSRAKNLIILSEMSKA